MCRTVPRDRPRILQTLLTVCFLSLRITQCTFSHFHQSDMMIALQPLISLTTTTCVQHLSKFMHLNVLEQISNPDFSALLDSQFLTWQVQNTHQTWLCQRPYPIHQNLIMIVYEPTYNETQQIIFCAALHSLHIWGTLVIVMLLSVLTASKSDTQFSLILWKPVVNIYTTRFNIQQFYVLPTQCMYFVWISEQTATVVLYNINWLVFITEI